MITHRLIANWKVQGFGYFLKQEIPTIAKILIPCVSQIDRLDCLHAKKFTWNCWLIALSKMLHNNWTHSCLGCWDTVTAPSWQRRFYIITVILTWVWLHWKQWCGQYMNSTKNSPSVASIEASTSSASVNQSAKDQQGNSYINCTHVCVTVGHTFWSSA